MSAQFPQPRQSRADTCILYCRPSMPLPFASMVTKPSGALPPSPASSSSIGLMAACGHTKEHWLHWIHLSGCPFRQVYSYTTLFVCGSTRMGMVPSVDSVQMRLPADRHLPDAFIRHQDLLDKFRQFYRIFLFGSSTSAPACRYYLILRIACRCPDLLLHSSCRRSFALSSIGLFDTFFQVYLTASSIGITPVSLKNAACMIMLILVSQADIVLRSCSGIDSIEIDVLYCQMLSSPLPGACSSNSCISPQSQLSRNVPPFFADPVSISYCPDVGLIVAGNEICLVYQGR